MPVGADGQVRNANCEMCVDKEQYDGGDTLGRHVNMYDGECVLLVLKGDDTMSRTAIEDMFDAMWTMTITMTTVGYGGKYPYTSSGRSWLLRRRSLGHCTWPCH